MRTLNSDLNINLLMNINNLALQKYTNCVYPWFTGIINTNALQFILTMKIAINNMKLNNGVTLYNIWKAEKY